MNSLNILSARVIGQTPPQTPTAAKGRSSSTGNRSTGRRASQRRNSDFENKSSDLIETGDEKERRTDQDGDDAGRLDITPSKLDETTPLLEDQKPESVLDTKPNKLHLVAKQLVDALTKSLKWVLSTLSAPGVYLVRCFYDDDGRFSPVLPIRRFRRTVPRRNGGSSTAQAVGLSGSSDYSENTISKPAKRGTRTKSSPRPERRSTKATYPTTSDSELDPVQNIGAVVTGRQVLEGSAESEESVPARRSIRIKLYNEDTAQQKKSKRSNPSTGRGSYSNDNEQSSITAVTLKSPTSPASSLRTTKYPRAPAPPRPLIPRRQPSYSVHTSLPSSRLPQKTLVIDLDETLIHSLAKGGRMSSGHMVEVKLNAAVGYGGTTLGPQHPILYYVHKRPHCDDFLRKVCKWYNLVVFTASVQEYADPVIDWLEQERKYFSARYYRQHCTFRNGAYIKDLSSVEPDLSKVMILDNSPLSYIFHE
ncbi:Nuclear envelope morphology protein 1, partial [Loxospora ochrophaea]|nr:Nuclear envelope morphology protein 1 [Loxospora ochrophaea]